MGLFISAADAARALRRFGRGVHLIEERNLKLIQLFLYFYGKNNDDISLSFQNIVVVAEIHACVHSDKIENIQKKGRMIFFIYFSPLSV